MLSDCIPETDLSAEVSPGGYRFGFPEGKGLHSASMAIKAARISGGSRASYPSGGSSHPDRMRITEGGAFSIREGLGRYQSTGGRIDAGAWTCGR